MNKSIHTRDSFLYDLNALTKSRIKEYSHDRTADNIKSICIIVFKSFKFK